MSYAKPLIAKSLTLFFNPFARQRYFDVAKDLSEKIYAQKSLYQSLQKRSKLTAEELRELIERSMTIMSFSTLLGYDFGKKFSEKEGIRAAMIGAFIGIILVVGNYTFMILFRKTDKEVEFSHVDVMDEEMAV